MRRPGRLRHHGVPGRRSVPVLLGRLQQAGGALRRQPQAGAAPADRGTHPPGWLPAVRRGGRGAGSGARRGAPRMIARPKRRGDLLLREVEEELLLFDPRTGEASLLNGTAAAIFDLCDGLTPLAALAEEVLGVLSADPETGRADVQRIIEELTGMGLIGGGG